MSNYLSSFFSVMISLPFSYGFVNVLLRHVTDYMIQKKKGCTEIHVQRIIKKVAVDFNGPLGYLIGHMAGKNFESCDPCNKQHDSRPNMGSLDAAIIKLLTFENLRMQREAGAMIQHDCTSHFDRI